MSGQLKGLLCNPVALLHFYLKWSPCLVIKLLVLCGVLYCFVAQSKTVSGKVQVLSYEGIICIDYL